MQPNSAPDPADALAPVQKLHSMAHMLVPFAASALPSAYVVHQSGALHEASERELLDRFAYRTEETAWTLGDDRSKLFYAERYGGAAISANGGGARCGLDGDHQIKGIGANPLVGRSGDRWHRDGALALSDCVREMIWGKVLNRVLPYGAVEVDCIIATGDTCNYRRADEAVTALRGLAVRQACIRPAHFMRSTFFKPCEQAERLLAPDRKRVIAAMEHLADCLPGHAEGGQRQRVVTGLAEFAARAARQLAVAHANRIMHGGLSPSNLALDGRWIDFGSTTSFADFRSHEDYHPGFWQEHVQILKVLSELVFHINKYLLANAELIDVDSVVGDFVGRYERETNAAFGRLVGYPDSLIRATFGDRYLDNSRLSALIVKTAMRCSGVGQRQSGSGNALSDVLSLLTTDRDKAHAHGRISDIVGDTHLAGGLITEYAVLSNAMVATAFSDGVTPDALAKLVRFNVEKTGMHASFPADADFEALLSSSSVARSKQELIERIDVMVDEALEAAAVIFERGDDYKVVLNRKGGNLTMYDAREDRIFNCQAREPEETGICEGPVGHDGMPAGARVAGVPVQP